jgi:hypothetical protein
MSSAQLDLRDRGELGKSRPDHDTVLDQSIPGICAEWFPDNEGNTWNIERTARIDDRAFVLVRYGPDDVGSDRFVVLLDFEPGEKSFTAHATYSHDAESIFGLLSTASGCPEDIPSVVVW